MVWVSSPMQFWASEQYARDIPLDSPQSYWVNPMGSPFDAGTIRKMRRATRQLNAAQDGDEALFMLTPNPEAY